MKQQSTIAGFSISAAGKRRVKWFGGNDTIPGTVIPGDPLIGDIDLGPDGLTYSYSMGGTSPSAGTNNLSWTWPGVIDGNALTFPGFATTRYVAKKLYLQRADSSDYAYELPARGGHEGQFTPMYERTEATVPLNEAATTPAHNGGPLGDPGSGDVGWATIYTWNAPSTIGDWPTTYVDSPGTGGTFVYRLLGIFQADWQSDPNRIEIDWNIVIVMQPPVVTYVQQGNSILLTVSNPNVT